MAYPHNTARPPRQAFHDSGGAKNETTCTVQNALAELLGSRFQELESASLRLNKMMNYSRSAQNRNELQAICDCANRHRALPEKIAAVPGIQSFQMQLAARMMIDQSGSVLNLGILLHRNFSCPYIPGSALKGITNHYVLDQVGADNEDYKRIFGTQECAGTVSFLNAFPVKADWKMVVDVLTRHNDPDEKIMDSQNPLPIFFPAVEKGCRFEFAVAPVSPGTNPGDVRQAAKWLKEALATNGVGAKTSAGYGWFKEVNA